MVNDKLTIYIRFNPDKYINSKGEKIDGCFYNTMNKLNVYKRKLKQRLKIVHSEIMKYTDYNNVKQIVGHNLIKQIKLFLMNNKINIKNIYQ